MSSAVRFSIKGRTPQGESEAVRRGPTRDCMAALSMRFGASRYSRADSQRFGKEEYACKQFIGEVEKNDRESQIPDSTGVTASGEEESCVTWTLQHKHPRLGSTTTALTS